MDKWTKIEEKKPEVGTGCIVIIGKTERDLFDPYTYVGPYVIFATYMKDPCCDNLDSAEPKFYTYNSKSLFSEVEKVTAWIPCPDYSDCELLHAAYEKLQKSP